MLNHGFVPGKRDWREDRIYRGGGIGKILGGKVMRVLRRVVREIRENVKRQDLTVQVQTRCLHHFTFGHGDSKR